MEEQTNDQDFVTVSPEEATILLDKMRSDPNSDLMNPNALPQKHQLAVERQLDLMRIANGEKVDLREHVQRFHERERQAFIDRYGYDPNQPRKMAAHGFDPFQERKISIDPASIGFGEKSFKSGFGNKIEDAKG